MHDDSSGVRQVTLTAACGTFTLRFTPQAAANMFTTAHKILTNRIPQSSLRRHGQSTPFDLQPTNTPNRNVNHVADIIEIA